MENPSSLRCSFCGKSQKDVKRLIASADDSPRVYICNECVAVCALISEDEKPEAPSPGARDRTR